MPGGRDLNVELRRASALCEGWGWGTCERPAGRGAAFGPLGCGAVPPVCAERCLCVTERQLCVLLAAVWLCPCLCRRRVELHVNLCPPAVWMRPSGCVLRGWVCRLGGRICARNER